MSEFNLQRARELCRMASDEPWQRDGCCGGEYYCVLAKTDTISDVVCKMDGKDQIENADFIAEARTLLPQACDEIERLRKDGKRLDWLEEAHFTAYRQRDPESEELYDHAVVVNEDAPTRRGILHKHLRNAIDAAMAESAALQKGQK